MNIISVKYCVLHKWEDNDEKHIKVKAKKKPYAHPQTYVKKTYCSKKCRITPWQEKNKNPHSDLMQ